MDNSKTLQRITRAGSVIMTTVISFVVYPPVLDAAGNSGVNWKNLFTFFAGICSILAYDQFRKRNNIRLFTFGLLGLLFTCLIAYQVMYNNYSMNCYENSRVVISKAPVKDSVRADLDAWKKKYQNPLQELIQAAQCNSTEVWEFKDLMIPYYTMISLYFAIILIITLLTVILSDQLGLSKQLTDNP
jgi:hypothetical protein